MSTEKNHEAATVAAAPNAYVSPADDPARDEHDMTPVPLAPASPEYARLADEAAGLTIDELCVRIEALLDAMMTEEPADIRRLLERKLDTGREFAVWNFTMGYCLNFADVLVDLRDEALNGDPAPDVATMVTVAARLCRWYAGEFDVTGKMSDAHALLGTCAEAYGRVADLAEFAHLTRSLQMWLVQLQFWCDLQLPWAAVSDLVHGDRLREHEERARAARG